MNKIFTRFILLFIMVFGLSAAKAQQAGKVVAECTITFSVTISDDNQKEHTTKVLYIKGRKTRSEIKNQTLDQATIFDSKTGEATVLKEVGGDKFMSQFSSEQWKQKNERWLAATTKITGETKKILNFNCRKAIITTKDSSSFVVYFTTDFMASASENPYQFKNIPGLILEYDSQTNSGKSIQFTALDINFNPIPAAKFTLPTTGYRII